MSRLTIRAHITQAETGDFCIQGHTESILLSRLSHMKPEQVGATAPACKKVRGLFGKQNETLLSLMGGDLWELATMEYC